MVQKLILHAGTPKTGTTSLQIYLEQHRADLLRMGILYPRTVRSFDLKPKHQWIVDALSARDGGDLMGKMNDVLAQIEPSTHTVILSAEGLFHHWWDFSSAGRQALASLADMFSVSVWVWFRDPISFVRSNYIQMLKNPRYHVACYGRDLSVDEVLDDKWFARHLDYIGFVSQMEEVLGRGAVIPFAYKGDTIDVFLSSLGVERTDRTKLNENRTLGEFGVRLLRMLNRHPLSPKKKWTAVVLINKLDALLGFASQPLRLGSKTEDLIRSLASESISALERDFGLSLRFQPSESVLDMTS